MESEKAVCKIPTKIKNVLMLLPCIMACWTHRPSLRAGREGPEQQKAPAGSLFHPFLEVRASFLQRSSGATPWHLAAEISKTGLKHGPLGEERGQATHPQKRGGACSHEHSEFMAFRDRSGLGGQKIPGVHGVGRQKP